MKTKMTRKLMVVALAVIAVTTVHGTDATAIAGAAAAPAAGTAASGSTAGTFLDLSQDASWVGGVKPSSDGISSFTNQGYVGTSVNVSFNKLNISGATTAIGLYGSVYRTTVTASEVRKITVGSGGISVAAGTSSPRFGENLVIDVGTADQPWVAPVQYNFLGRVSGSATITVSGASGVWLRSNNSTTDATGYPTAFTGKWKVSSGSLLTVGSAGIGETALGAATASVELNGGVIRYYSNSGSTLTKRPITLSASSTMRAYAGSSFNVNQPISGGTIETPYHLTLDASATGTGTALNLGGDLSGHVGSILIAKNYSGFSVSLANGSTNSFALGLNHVADGVDTTSQALIRAGTGSNATALTLNGVFTFSYNSSEFTKSNSWTLVDTRGLNTTYGANFSLPGFTAGEGSAGSRTWTRKAGNDTWTYAEGTGLLTFTTVRGTLIRLF